MQGSHNPFPKHVGDKELQLEERLMTIIGMSMMKERRDGQGRRARNRIKMKIPSFQGKSNPEAYLE